MNVFKYGRIYWDFSVVPKTVFQDFKGVKILKLLPVSFTIWQVLDSSTTCKVQQRLSADVKFTTSVFAAGFAVC